MDFDSFGETSLTRAQVEKLAGPVVLQFGASWCGICRAFAPQFENVLRDFPQVRHVFVEDGPGRPLGRSFHVKLWPTFVFLRDGKVVQQSVRPSAETVREGFLAITQEEAGTATQ